MDIPTPRQANLTAILVGRRACLRVVTPKDYDFLFAIATHPEIILRWRWRGVTPSPEQFAASLWQGVLAQFVVTAKTTGEPVGLVSGYNADFRNDNVSLSLILAPGFDGSGWTLEATALFVNYLFVGWNFRKVFLEVLEFNYFRLASGAGKLFEVEGCLKECEFFDGRYWHKYFLTIDRALFQASLDHLGFSELIR